MRHVWKAVLIAALSAACVRPAIKTAPRPASPLVQPIGATGTGNALVLATVNGRRLALIADEDAKAILTVDVDTKSELAQTVIGGTPGQLQVMRDGRVLATVRDANKLLVLRIDDP